MIEETEQDAQSKQQDEVEDDDDVQDIASSKSGGEGGSSDTSNQAGHTDESLKGETLKNKDKDTASKRTGKGMVATAVGTKNAKNYEVDLLSEKLNGTKRQATRFRKPGPADYDEDEDSSDEEEEDEDENEDQDDEREEFKGTQGDSGDEEGDQVSDGETGQVQSKLNSGSRMAAGSVASSKKPNDMQPLLGLHSSNAGSGKEAGSYRRPA